MWVLRAMLVSAVLLGVPEPSSAQTDPTVAVTDSILQKIIDIFTVSEQERAADEAQLVRSLALELEMSATDFKRYAFYFQALSEASDPSPDIYRGLQFSEAELTTASNKILTLRSALEAEARWGFNHIALMGDLNRLSYELRIMVEGIKRQPINPNSIDPEATKKIVDGVRALSDALSALSDQMARTLRS